VLKVRQATTLQYIVGFGMTLHRFCIDALLILPAATGCSALLMAYLRFRV
jgi:hypothetical protein